jgi:hypothetical protein
MKKQMSNPNITQPIKVIEFNSENYYLIIEDSNNITHYFHHKHSNEFGEFEQGEYDGISYDIETDNLSTDVMCDIITTKIGIPLPTYDYEYRKYISSIPQNITIDNVVGIENADLHETFRDACSRIINWYKNLE